MKKVLAVGVILLFIGLTFTTSITAYIPVKKRIETGYESEVTVSCKYFTVNGIQEIEKVIASKDAEHLFELMDTSDSTTITTKLSQFNLIPNNLSEKETEDLINGEYGQKYSKKNLNPKSNFNLIETDWKNNSVCNVKGEGVDAFFITPRMLFTEKILSIISLFMFIPLAIIWLICSGLSYFLFGNNMDSYEFSLYLIFLFILITFPALIPSILYKISNSLRPIKCAPTFVMAELYDACGRGLPYLETSGQEGYWKIEDHKGIAIYMIGFFGLWMTILDDAQTNGAKVRGFCKYITAKGMDDWPWDWRDDFPWGKDLFE